MDAKTKRDESVELVPPDMLPGKAIVEATLGTAAALARLESRVEKLETYVRSQHSLLARIIEFIDDEDDRE